MTPDGTTPSLETRRPIGRMAKTVGDALLGSEPIMTWYPSETTAAPANLTRAIEAHGFGSYEDFHRWSITHRAAFWADVVERLGIVLTAEPAAVLGSDDPTDPHWMQGAMLNIAESCFTAVSTDIAVIHESGDELVRASYGDLLDDVRRFAGGLDAVGFSPGDRLAIAMPMTYESVVSYLGTVWAGGTVVSIADSFAAPEITERLRITGTGLVVTQDRVLRGDKELSMAEKVVSAGAGRLIVVSTGGGWTPREDDLTWDAFLSSDTVRPATSTSPDHPTNILFSSGTTGNPKAIPWTQLTPIKAAMDGHFHQDIHPSDTVAWPTNLGWMMGPWLIYACLINRATIALSSAVPTGEVFTRFVEDAEVTILGVVPSLVAAWRSSGALDGRDWTRIRAFSSTGEASNASDMEWLSLTAGNKPIIEYCGGTEVGGGYLTSTVLHPSVPSHFTTPALGLDIVIIDESGHAADRGEVFLVPPSIGLSEALLNADHEAIYHSDTPSLGGRTLRRHGDELVRLPDGTYRVLGRADDTMNLGGIKIGSAELERALFDVPGLVECAAVAVTAPEGGPQQLVVFAVVTDDLSPDEWAASLTERIRAQLNPLFRVSRVILRESLPRTASGKVMRRKLRDIAGPVDPGQGT